LLFEPAALAPEAAQSALAAEEGLTDAPADARVAALKRELRAKDEALLATQEEMQTANEELQSTNEELQSTNEELQSTNEELETSKEELQSVNEELTTVNAELQSKVTDLSRVNNDMNNLLAGTGIGTLFVDQSLLIRRFTPAVTQFINLIPTDVGRPLAHIVSNLVGYDGLVADVQAVLDTLTPGNVEVRAKSGVGYLLRIRPYRTAENAVEGAVITFSEMAAPLLAPGVADGAGARATAEPRTEP
jgi:two-component system CheB/CheR fusion protein